MSGSSSDDTIDGSLTATSVQTLTPTDSLDGGAGDDILIGTINSSVTPRSITNIETVQIGVATNASTLDLTNATGVKNLTVAGSTAAATVAGIGKATNVTLRDSTQAHTVVFNDVTGASDTATINIANLTGAPVLTIANVETLTYNSTGATANSVGSTTGAGANSLTGATTLNITGTTAINVGTLAAATKLDGSKHAPTDNVGITATLSASAVAVNGGTGNDSITISSTGSDNVAGGGGNDTIVFSNAGGLSLSDTIDGGAGTDTLRAVTADLTGISGSAPASFLITNVETLQASDAFTGTLRAPNISAAVNRVNLAPIATGTVVGGGTIVGPAGAFTVALGGTTTGVTYVAADALNAGLTITATGTATTDSLTLNNVLLTNQAGGSALDVFANQAIAINGYETVTLSTGTVGGAANTINTLTMTPDIGGTARVTVSGANGLTFAGVVSADSLDASALSGAISMAAGANTATTVRGGTGSDTLRGNAALANSITGGAGDDAITGGAGNDTLVGGDGVDTLTANAGNDSISGGVGNDTIVMGGNLSSGDTIDGGDGTDTMTISAALGTTGVPTLTSIEVLGLAAAGVTQDMNAFSGAGLTTVLIDSTGTSLTNAAANLTTVNLSTNASTGTFSFGRLINTTKDSVTLNFAGGGDTTLANGTSLAGEEIITLGRYGTTSGAGRTVTFTTPTLTAMESLTLTGEHNFAIGNNGATAFATLNAATASGSISVDASASTVNFTATVSGANQVTLTGGSGNDVLPGTAFADSLTGGDGNDNITAGAGDDIITPGRGSDTVVGGDGTGDTVVYTALSSVFDAGGGVANAGMAVNLSAASITAATVRGNSVLPTGSTAAALNVGLANLSAGTAAYIGAETGVGSGVSLVSSAVDMLSGIEHVTGTAGADIVIGSTGDNSISGAGGIDYIDGGAGNDTITGGTEHDYLTGGAGSDRFVFAAGVTDTVAAAASIAGVDRITDLVANAGTADLIDLTVTVASVGTAVTGALAEATFVANMNTLLAVGGGAGFNTAAAGGITAAVVTGTGGLANRIFLAVDLDGNDTFTAADFVVEITGATLTSLTTATFV